MTDGFTVHVSGHVLKVAALVLGCFIGGVVACFAFMAFITRNAFRPPGW